MRMRGCAWSMRVHVVHDCGAWAWNIPHVHVHGCTIGDRVIAGDSSSLRGESPRESGEPLVSMVPSSGVAERG